MWDTVRPVSSEGPPSRARELIHELNNALGLVINYAILLGEDLRDHPGYADDVREIRAAGERAADLVRELSAVLRQGGDGGGAGGLSSPSEAG
jgi:signal transduction histidine kinase